MMKTLLFFLLLSSQIFDTNIIVFNSLIQTKSEAQICFCGKICPSEANANEVKMSAGLGCIENKKMIPIYSFNMQIIKKGVIEEAASVSNAMSAEQKKLLDKISAGDKIVFNNTKAKNKDGKIVAVNSITIAIK